MSDVSVLITFINAWSVSLATKVQNFFTVMKLIAVAVIIGGGVYMLATGTLDYQDDRASILLLYLKVMCYYSCSSTYYYQKLVSSYVNVINNL